VKRICLLGAAIAGLLIIGVTSAMASAPHASKASSKSKTAGTKVSCTSKLILQVPTSSTTVTQGALDGTEYGNTKCDKTIGRGVQFETFATDAGGNVSGNWQQYFNTGTLYGKYTLTPDDNNPPTTSSFTAASYVGTVTIKGGTGVDAKASGTGTLKCSTQDSIHFACTDKVKLVLPSTSTGKK
jgi:hypothetical protein